MKLKQLCTFDDTSNTFNLMVDNGLLSNASITLNNLMLLHKNKSDLIKVNWPSTSRWNLSDNKDRNVYDLYFKTIDRGESLSLSSDFYFDLMVTNCDNYDFSLFAKYRDTYFNLSDAVNQRVQYFIDKYSIKFEETVAIRYRGTDKMSEVPRIHPKLYLQPYFPKFKNKRAFIVTDQQQALQFFKKKIEKSFSIEETPVSSRDTGLHNVDSSTPNYNLGIDYLASVYIMSKCKYVIYDTNNAALWLCIFRGSTVNTYQIHGSIQIFDRFTPKED